MTISEILNEFKEAETADNIVPLVDNDELRNGLVAWKSVVVEYINEDDKDNPVRMTDASASEPKKWEWLWTQVKFDMQQFAVVAGCRMQDAGSLFNRLKGLRLIYPDSTINSLASKYLQSIIMSKLSKQKK